jgi:hypothetical protein
MDRGLGVTDGFEHSVHQSTESSDESGLISIVDIEALIGPEPSANIPLFDLTAVAFGIDDPDTGRSDGQMVNIASSTRYLPAMQEHGPFTHCFGEKVGKATFAHRPVRPGFGGLRFVREKLHDPCHAPPLVLDPLLSAPMVLFVRLLGRRSDCAPQRRMMITMPSVVVMNGTI